MLSVLWIPLVIELANIAVHHVLRDRSEGVYLIDIVSIVVTVVVLFFAGWTAARKVNRVTLAILGGLLIWACSVLLIGFLMGAEGEARAGFLLSALLSVPVVLAVSAVGAVVGKRSRPPIST
jgi:ABC-type uncharacterized transport system permease subunit